MERRERELAVAGNGLLVTGENMDLGLISDLNLGKNRKIRERRVESSIQLMN